MWNSSYRTPTECWMLENLRLPQRKKKIPTCLDRAEEKRKKQRQKNRDGTCTSGRELWRRKFPHTKKPLHWWGWGGEGGKLQSHRGEHSNRGAEGKVERFLHRGLVLTITHQPEMLSATDTPVAACTACHCQGPVIQGQLPRENTQWASGCCNVMSDSAAPGMPCIPIMTTVPFPIPRLSEQGSPNQLLF